MLKYLTPINMTQNELLNAVVQNLAAAPETPVEGQFYHDTTTHKTMLYNGTAWNEMTTSLATAISAGVIQLAGDLGGTAASPSVAFVGGKSASAVAAAVDASHAQNTDTGTTSATFQLNSGSSGVKLKDNAGVLEVRNGADNAYADLKVNNLTVDGTQTTINSNEVNIGDSEILLNADITASTMNESGGIAVKRLQSDNTTRGDAKMDFNNSTGRWEATFGPVNAVQTQVVATKFVQAIGLGDTTKSFAIAHNIGTRDVSVTIRTTASPYEVVFTQVECTDANTVTVSFSKAPALNEYTVTIIG